MPCVPKKNLQTIGLYFSPGKPLPVQPRLCQATGNSSPSGAILSPRREFRPRWSAGDFSFCAQLFSFREGLPSGLREKGRTVHFPFLPCVLSVLKITDNSIYLLISRLINILYLVLQVVASDWRIEAYKDAFEKKYDKLHEVVWQITRGSCPKIWQITRGRPFSVWQITRGFSGLKNACEKQFSHVDW